MLAVLLAVLAILCLLLALFGVAVGIDLVTLGLVFMAGWMLVTSLPARMRP